MSDLQGFASVTQSGQGNHSLVLANQRAGQEQQVAVRTARFARWFERYRISENRAVTNQFLEALKTTYGEETARAAVASSGLNTTLTWAKPLRVRVARIVMSDAALHARNTQLRNEAVADSYANGIRATSIWANGIRAGSTCQSAIPQMIERAALSNHAGDNSIARLLDYGELAGKVREAILAAGEEGEGRFRQLSKGQAGKICRSIVEQSLKDKFHAARSRAMAALNPQVPGTVAHHEFSCVFAKLVPAVTLGRYGLSPEVAKFFAREFARAIDSGAIPADELDDRGSLQELARNTAERFLAERGGARAKVAEGAGIVGKTARKALLDQVTCDAIPENLVGPLVDTCLLAKGELACLACPSSSPKDLKKSIEALQLALASTWTAAHATISQENEELYYRSAWRFLLAPGGSAQARAILDRLTHQESLLRGIVEAAAWYANGFQETSEARRTLRGGRHSPKGRIHDDKSFELANSYWKTLLWLTRVAAETADSGATPGAPFRANPNPTDETVAALRDFGIPFPAPDRMGRANDNAPLSQPAMAKMQEAIDHKVDETPELHKSGVTNDCVKFLRANELVRHPPEYKARFIIDGTELPRQVKAGTVVEKLKTFCTDNAGNVNGGLLANLSRVVNHHTFDCLYSGCMNPWRPDLSIMNAYPKGAMEEHAYLLWKNENGEARLGVFERITPQKLYPMGPNAGLVTKDGKPDDDALEWSRLSGQDSNFSIRAAIHFNPDNYRPMLQSVHVGYRLAPGNPNVAEPRYPINEQDAPGETRVSAGGGHATLRMGNPAGEGQHPESFEAETAPRYEPLYAPVRRHIARRTSQSAA